MSKATRALGTVDRILQNKNLVIITDSGQTIFDHPGHVDILAKPKLTVKDILFLRSLKVAALCLLLFVMPVCAGQREPDAKRVREIAVALQEHHYITGYPDRAWSWPRLQEVCKNIAKEHGWQTHHAPDARVLILLELGNPHSDPDVVKEKLSHPELDQ